MPFAWHIGFIFVCGILLTACYARTQVNKLKNHYTPKNLPGAPKYPIGLKVANLITANQLPAHSILALIFFEDDLFFTHRGFNWREIICRLRLWLSGQDSLKGGSSISQQLAKICFTSRRTSPLRKAYEFILTIFIELTYSKLEILSLYVNCIKFGATIIGVGRAAEHYFNKNATDLTFTESLILFSVIPSPSQSEDILLIEPNSDKFDFRKCEEKARDILRFVYLQMGNDGLNRLNELKLSQVLPFLEAFKEYQPQHFPGDLQATLAYWAIFITHKVKQKIIALPLQSREMRLRLRIAFSKNSHFLLELLSNFRSDNFESLTKEVDWSTFVNKIEQHHLCPMVYNIISNDDIDAPADFLNSLREKAQKIVGHTLKLRNEAALLYKSMLSNELEAIYFKGVVLADRIYPNYSLRDSRDIDLVFRREQIQRARDWLMALGYAPAKKGRPVAKLFKSSESFVNLQSNCCVDLHCSFIEPWYPQPLVNDLWQRAQTHNMNGTDFKILAPEDELLLLCLHGSKHMWCRLSWIVDIQQFMCSTVVDWDRCYHEAKNIGADKLLIVSLRLAGLLLGCELPREIDKYIKFKEFGMSERWRLLEWALEGRVQQKAKLENYLMNYTLLGNFTNKLRFVSVKTAASVISKLDF